jgi:hypothetical protein
VSHACRCLQVQLTTASRRPVRVQPTCSSHDSAHSQSVKLHISSHVSRTNTTRTLLLRLMHRRCCVRCTVAGTHCCMPLRLSRDICIDRHMYTSQLELSRSGWGTCTGTAIMHPAHSIQFRLFHLKNLACFVAVQTKLQ